MQRYRFRPNFKLAVLTFVFLPLLITLGVWQLHRADFKHRLQRDYQTRTQATPVTLTQTLSQSVSALEGVPIQLHGHFDNTHPLLVDNKIYRHQPGYHVLLPFISGSSRVLVNLGWIPQGPSRAILPRLAPINGEFTLSGWVMAYPSKTFTLGNVEEPGQTSWPLRIEQAQYGLIVQKMPYPILPFMVLLSPQYPFGYTRDWTLSSLTPERHLGYAVQWFGLAITLVILFIFSSLHRNE